MANTNEGGEYTLHNYDAVNDHVNELANRDRIITRAHQVQVLRQAALPVTTILLGIGLAILLAMWGISLMKSTKTTREVVVEKPITLEPRITVNVADPVVTANGGTVTNTDIDKARDAARKKMSEMESEAQEGSSSSETEETSEATSSTTEQSESTRETDSQPPPAGAANGHATRLNHVIFKITDFGKDGIENIAVGMQYSTIDAETPDNQWCYVEKQMPDGSVSKVDLVTWRNGVTEPKNLNTDIASRLGTSVSTLQEAQGLCAFR